MLVIQLPEHAPSQLTRRPNLPSIHSFLLSPTQPVGHSPPTVYESGCVLLQVANPPMPFKNYLRNFNDSQSLRLRDCCEENSCVVKK